MTRLSQSPEFTQKSVHKRDVFSETVSGHLNGMGERDIAMRRIDQVPWYARPVARYLLWREVRALKCVRGIEGAPELIDEDTSGLLRVWTEGLPLQHSKPDQAAWYRDAKRLLREMRKRGVTHNDAAKPQNWLLTPDGRAALIDFQIAKVHRRRGKIFRLMAREDLRHLLKQKRNFAPDLLLPSERAMLAQKSLPARIWMKTGKRVYNIVTRRIFNWSDGEGVDHRIEIDGPAIKETLKPMGEVVLCRFRMPSGGAGIYAFVETEISAPELRSKISRQKVELIQPVAQFPRDAAGKVDQTLFQLIADNRMDDIARYAEENPEFAALTQSMADGRQNFTDRLQAG